jgi:SET domain-containing protein
LLIEYNLRIKTSTIPNAGLGLFAIINNTPDHDQQIVFRKDDKICPYNGQILTTNQHLNRYAEEPAPYSAKLYRQNGIQMYEDASLQRGIGSLINHSCRRDNCRMSVRRDNTIILIATRNIKNHAEILLNYGPDYRFNVQHIRSVTNNRRVSL